MAKDTNQESPPLHLENTVNSFAKEELRLPKAFNTYRRMLEDEAIGGGISLIQNLANKTPYSLEPHKDSSEAEIKLVKALNTSLRNLEGMNQVEFLNYILSLISYGHSMFEMVFKREEGSLVYKTFSPIHPINIKKYVYDRNVLTSLELNPSENDGIIENKVISEKSIKGEKVLMFKINSDLDNPLGRSLLSRCYAPWKKKQIVGEYELISVAKNLSGVMKIEAPSEYINDYQNNPQSDNARALEDLMNQAELMHAGKSSMVVVASDTNDTGGRLFNMTTVGNKDGNEVDTNAIMNRLDNAMLMTLYTDILSLGQGSGGSFALSDSKTTLLTLFIDSLFNTISASFQEAIKRAYILNGIKPKTEYAKLTFAPVEQLDWEAFTRGWQRLIQSKAVVMDDKLEEFLRERGKAPAKDSTTSREFDEADKQDDNERTEKEK